MILGLQRNYAEDGVEADEMMAPSSSPPARSKSSKPNRPPRKGSLPRNGELPTMNGTIESGKQFLNQ